MELSQGKDRFKEGIALRFSDAFLTLEQVQSQAKQQKAKLLTCLVYFQLHQKEACSLSINSFLFKVLPINNALTLLFLYKLNDIMFSLWQFGKFYHTARNCCLDASAHMHRDLPRCPV